MYTVDQLIEYVKGKPVIEVNLDELRWQYPHDRISKKRLAKIEIDGYPIIVERLDSKTLRTLDGFHRAYKAIKEGRTTIKAVLLTKQDFVNLKYKV